MITIDTVVMNVVFMMLSMVFHVIFETAFQIIFIELLRYHSGPAFGGINVSVLINHPTLWALLPEST